MSQMKTLTINGTKYDIVPVVPATSVTLLANAWVGDGDRYSQVVEVPGVTDHTKVDLQPTSAQLEEFHYKVLAFVAENDGGAVTVYSIGDKPENDHTIQVTKTEVEGVGKIRGNTVGTSMPRPDWNQTDPSKADYIQNKPDIDAIVNAGVLTVTDPNNDGRIVFEYGGEVVPGGGSSGGGGSVDQEEINKLMQEIKKIKAELNYKEITIIKFNNPAAGTHEIGSTINGVSLSWELSKNPESQTLNGSALGTDVRSKSYDGPITTNQTYSLSVTDEKGATASASSSITFLNGVYYGVLESGAAIDSAVVRSLTRKLQGSKGITFTADAGATQKIVYALPTRYGTPNFNVGGFDGGFAKANTFDFTNASGYTESYDVWLSENVNLGSTTVKVS